ncbi:unnamed protein product [Rangifer tarandus platyrhynchus]|uniref:Uncharacterized protein n=1 Tax=Rangifer tarandus platyrhynchus TaxID=3082113 RepID=A0ABN8ZK94_RANTA|nr:unnamed protein product [Rangifer tarandus platyrhynchus]
MEAGADIREGGSGGQSQAGRDRFLVGVAFAAPARPFLPRRAARRSGGGSAAATGAARGRGAGSRGRGDAGRGVRNDQQSFAKLWYVIPVTASTAMQSLGLTQISRLYLRSWLWDTPPRLASAQSLCRWRPCGDPAFAAMMDALVDNVDIGPESF